MTAAGPPALGAQVTLHVCLDARQKGHQGLIRKMGLGMAEALVEV